jgi:hypothetical protein
VQNAAEASQKFTCPGATLAAPAFTVAVRVTRLPEATDVTAVPPEATLIVVVVTIFVWAVTQGAKRPRAKPTHKARSGTPLATAPVRVKRFKVGELGVDKDDGTIDGTNGIPA